MTIFQIRPSCDQILHHVDGGKAQFVAPAKNLDGGDHNYRAIAIRLDAQFQVPQSDGAWEFTIDEYDLERLCQELRLSEPRLAYSISQRQIAWRRERVCWESKDKSVRAVSGDFCIKVRLQVNNERVRLLPDGRLDYMPRTSDVEGLVKVVNEVAYCQQIELDYQVGDKGTDAWRPLPACRTYVSTAAVAA